MKKLSIIFILTLFITLPNKAKVIIPDDMPSITALIELHKKIAKAEDNSLRQIGESYTTQVFSSKAAEKYNDVKNTLNTKLYNLNQNILLFSLGARTATKLKNTIEEYYKFVNLVRKNINKKPQIAWYFAEANYNVSQRIKLLKQSAIVLISANSPILRASLSEKIELFDTILSQIDVIEGIINQAYMWCKCITIGGFEYDYIWDILNSEATSKIATEVISEWNQNI